MGKRPLPSIFNRQSEIVNEFQEPLRDVVAGFIPMGMTRIEVAETLEVDPRSLRTFCEQSNIHFPRNQPGRAERVRGSANGRARIIRYAGRSLCVSEWAREYGIKPLTLHKRLQRGKSFRDALA